MTCPNCDSIEVSEYIRGYKLCVNCGLAFLPSDVNLMQYYASGAYRETFKQSNEAEHQQRRARHILPYIGRPKVFIDFGCSIGLLVDAVADTGAECYGVDLDTSLRNNVYSRIQDVPKQADCISLIHSLEHTPRPSIVLRDVYDKLNIGGRAVIEVPNGGVNVEREFYETAFSFPHVSMFSDESLAWTMQAAGFEVVSMELHGRGGVPRASEWYYLLAVGIRPLSD